jgi:hypothetical protein
LLEVLGQYHARGVVPLRRQPLRLCEMTADRAPWMGAVTALTLLSPLEVQRHMVGDWEINLLVAVGAAAPDAPPRGDRKICESPSSR